MLAKHPHIVYYFHRHQLFFNFLKMVSKNVILLIPNKELAVFGMYLTKGRDNSGICQT